MPAALGWIVVAALLALWSLVAWAIHGVAAWTVSNAAALTGSASGVAGLQLPDWLSPWVPTELVPSVTAMRVGLGPAIDGLLQAAPALASGLSVAAWSVWGFGAILIMSLGAAVHVILALWRRRDGGSTSGPKGVRSPAF